MNMFGHLIFPWLKAVAMATSTITDHFINKHARSIYDTTRELYAQ